MTTTTEQTTFERRITHNLRLHLDNDERIYRHFQYTLPRIHARRMKMSPDWTYTVPRSSEIADYLKDYCNDLALADGDDTLTLLQSDIISCALAWVDWEGMGTIYAENFPELVEDEDEEDED